MWEKERFEMSSTINVTFADGSTNSFLLNEALEAIGVEMAEVTTDDNGLVFVGGDAQDPNVSFAEAQDTEICWVIMAIGYKRTNRHDVRLDAIANAVIEHLREILDDLVENYRPVLSE
jgi:hypothetical protein